MVNYIRDSFSVQFSASEVQKYGRSPPMKLKTKKLPLISNQPELKFFALETLQKFFMYLELEMMTSFQNKAAIEFEVGLLLMTVGFLKPR